MDRHLELQKRKVEQERAKQERANQVFDFSQKYDSKIASGKPHYTIPKPFALSEVSIWTRSR